MSETLPFWELKIDCLLIAAFVYCSLDLRARRPVPPCENGSKSAELDGTSNKGAIHMSRIHKQCPLHPECTICWVTPRSPRPNYKKGLQKRSTRRL